MTFRIFIVENHEWARDALARMLDLQPELEVCGAVANAEEALKLLPADADILLTDISLGAMSGIELIKIVRERWPNIRCLVLSNHPAEMLSRTALDAGSADYIEKGDGPRLLSAIESLIQEQRAQASS